MSIQCSSSSEDSGDEMDINDANDDDDDDGLELESINIKRINKFQLKIDTNCIQKKEKEINCIQTKDLNNNDIFHVIDFNVDEEFINSNNHHNNGNRTPSLFNIGNRTPSLGSMIITYPDTNDSAGSGATVGSGSVTSMIKTKTFDLKIPKQYNNTTNINTCNTRKDSMSSTTTLRGNSGDMPPSTYLFSNSGKLLYKIKLPRGLPLSTILIENNTLRSRIIALYDKYIDNNSIHELNLSFHLKNRIQSIFKSEKVKDNDDNDLYFYNILDEVAISILKLMRDSFQRFNYKPNNKNKDNNNKQKSVEINVIAPILRRATSYNDILKEYRISI